MRTLFAFIRKQYFFFLFISLELIAVLLLISHNPYPHTKVINSTNIFTGKVNALQASVSDYFYLKKANLALADENARLRNILKTSFLLSDTNEYVFLDTNFRFIPARVISNSTQRRNNYIMIDKGRKHGLQEEMGVISPSGLTGIVIEVSENFSTVMSLLHRDARFSAKIRKNGQLANIVWDGYDYRHATLLDIPNHIRLEAGDTIETSGFSFFFPAGITIGTVEELQSGSTENLHRATIRLSVDFNSLYQVYVVKNLMSQEQRNLLKQQVNE